MILSTFLEWYFQNYFNNYFDNILKNALKIQKTINQLNHDFYIAKNEYQILKKNNIYKTNWKDSIFLKNNEFPIELFMNYDTTNDDKCIAKEDILIFGFYRRLKAMKTTFYWFMEQSWMTQSLYFSHFYTLKSRIIINEKSLNSLRSNILNNKTLNNINNEAIEQNKIYLMNATTNSFITNRSIESFQIPIRNHKWFNIWKKWIDIHLNYLNEHVNSNDEKYNIKFNQIPNIKMNQITQSPFQIFLKILNEKYNYNINVDLNNEMKTSSVMNFILQEYKNINNSTESKKSSPMNNTSPVYNSSTSIPVSNTFSEWIRECIQEIILPIVEGMNITNLDQNTINKAFKIFYLFEDKLLWESINEYVEWKKALNKKIQDN